MTTGKKLAITAAALVGFIAFANWIAAPGDPPISEAAEQRELREHWKRQAREREREQRNVAIEDERELTAWHSCQRQIEGMLRYDYDWMLGGGVVPGKHAGYGRRAVDHASHTITYSGSELEARNGFGARARMRYGCEWNYRRNAVRVLYLETAVQ